MLLFLSVLTTVQNIGRADKFLDSFWKAVEYATNYIRFCFLGVGHILSTKRRYSAPEDVLTDTRLQLRVSDLRVRSIAVNDRRVVSMSKRNFPSEFKVWAGTRDPNRRVFINFSVVPNHDTTTPVCAANEIGKLFVRTVQVFPFMHSKKAGTFTSSTSTQSDRLWRCLKQSCEGERLFSSNGCHVTNK